MMIIRLKHMMKAIVSSSKYCKSINIDMEYPDHFISCQLTNCNPIFISSNYRNLPELSADDLMRLDPNHFDWFHFEVGTN